MIKDISTAWIVTFVILAIWELYWKGLALWRAAKRDESVWFVALLIINTAGLLPIAYLLLTRDKNSNLQQKNNR